MGYTCKGRARLARLVSGHFTVQVYTYPPISPHHPRDIHGLLDVTDLYESVVFGNSLIPLGSALAPSLPPSKAPFFPSYPSCPQRPSQS